MSKQQLQKEIEYLQRQLEEKQSALAAMPEKWEPKGGGFWIDSEGTVRSSPTSERTRVFGVESSTREQAEKAAKEMRAHNRLMAYVAEFAPDSSCNVDAYIARRKDGGQWEAIVNGTRSKAVMVYMPYDVAAKLAEKLNSGEVEL